MDPQDNQSIAQNDQVQSPVTSQDQQVASSEASAQSDYVANVGQAMVDLLTDISMSDERKQKVSDEMRLPVEKITEILTTLLGKVDAGSITEEEIALILAAPVADSPTNESPSM